MKNALFISMIILIVFMLSSCGGGGSSSTSTSTTGSNNPSLSSYTATPTLLTAGSSATLTVTAADQDNDTLTYDYSASGGTVTGSGASVTWTAPAAATAGTTFTVTVTVKDGTCSSGCPSSVKTFEVASASNIPSLSSIQTSIFTPSCASAGCHGGLWNPTLSSGTSYSTLVNVNSHVTTSKKRVVPGEPDISVLYLRVSGTTEGTQMPDLQPALSTTDQNKIRDWIRGGAKND